MSRSSVSTVFLSSLRHVQLPLKALFLGILVTWGAGALAQGAAGQGSLGQGSSFQSDSTTVAPASTLPAASGVSRTAHWNMRRWVDKAGVVHYGDAASAPAHADRLTVSGTSDPGANAPAPPAPTADGAASTEPKTPVVMPDISSWPKDAQGNRIAPNAQAACSVARANKQALGDVSRPALTHDAQGAAHLLTDAERTAQAAKADQDIGAYCVN